MGIVLASNFDVNTGLPLDSRTKVADNTARDAIGSGVRYEGLTVYVVATAKNWQLQGGITNSNWVEPSGADATKANLAGGNTFTGTQTLSNDLIVAGLIKRSVSSTITAFATGGQASATALTKDINRVTVCATAGDSVKLPTLAGTTGLMIFVQNDGAASLNVYPFLGESINALAVNTAIAVPAGTNIIFMGVTTGIWKSFSGGGGARSRGGLVALALNDTQATVTFSSALTSAYTPTCTILTPDSEPIWVQSIVSAQTLSGFTVKFNAAMDSSNYVLYWTATEHA